MADGKAAGWALALVTSDGAMCGPGAPWQAALWRALRVPLPLRLPV
jgi:hypothetical protein